MSWLKQINRKIFSDIVALQQQIADWKNNGDKIVFTNGCFDLIHLGHIDYLSKTADLGTKLVIGVNTDASVAKLKGPSRPIIDEQTRVTKLASLSFVNAVILFDEQTPLGLIQVVQPDLLVKGGDYTVDTVVGAEFVQTNGGSVEIIPFLPGHSSSILIDKILKG